jgi:hypothetical protein
MSLFEIENFKFDNIPKIKIRINEKKSSRRSLSNEKKGNHKSEREK